MIFTPIKILISYIPFIGKFLGAVAGFVAKFVGCILGLALSFLVIAVSWIAVRPAVGIPILLISVGLVIYAVWQGKKKKAEDNVSGGYGV
jgi:high-affinity Fe2+/Pb2+ permease